SRPESTVLPPPTVIPCPHITSEGATAHDPPAHELRYLHGPLPPHRRKPHPLPPARPRAHLPSRQPRLRRGLDRRAPLRRLGDHRQPRSLHRRRRRTHQENPPRHRRRLHPLSPPLPR